MRNNLSHTRFIQRIGATAQAPLDDGRQDVAERLSQWVSAFDAITLRSVHQTLLSSQALPDREALTEQLTVLEQALCRVYAALENAVAANDIPPERLPAAADVATSPSDDFARKRQRYQKLQKLMETQVGCLRTQIRGAMTTSSPAMQQLAALDAVWERTLAAREQKLLASVPLWLQRQKPNREQSDADSPTTIEVQEKAAFIWQAAAQAELEVRLQPVHGLLDALRNEIKKNT